MVTPLFADPTTPDHVAVVQRVQDHAAEHYDEVDVLPAQLAERLLERLELLTLQPSRILDLGCGTGRDLAFLRRRYRSAQCIGLDISVAMLERARRRFRWWRRPQLVCADAAQLPLADNSVDLVLSSLMLPWCAEPHHVFAEIQRVLTPGGALLFTSAGPDTLMEYRDRWYDRERNARCFGLLDMHDLGDVMLSSGLSAPVLDRTSLTIDYPSVAALEAELRALGCANVASGRRRGLMGRNHPLCTTAQHSVTGRFKVTFELVQGHAWKGVPRPVAGPLGEVRVPLSSLQRSARRSSLQQDPVDRKFEGPIA